MGSRYLARKIVQAILTIVFIVLLNFVLFRMMPGSPDRVLARNLPDAARAELRERWGLDQPLIPDQLVAYIGAIARGDLGSSYKFSNTPVTEVIGDRIWPTLILFGLGELIAIVVGLGLGAYSGWRRGGPVDYVGNGFSLILYSMPYFVIGMILLIVFATTLGWFPTSGMFSLGHRFDSPVEQIADFAWHLFLPLMTVAIGLIGQYSILMRSSIIDTLTEDYVTTAKAKGLTDGRVLRSHALPNARLPAVTLIAINLGYVIAGAITVEVVFGWPGIGTLTVTALNARDYPVLQGIFLLLSISVVIANLAADLIYGYLDPRVRT
ncbi:MAG: ABC transporter permease [Chloroflexi bacterium]|nr:ABC transporter permease [Chloroflexota bacterium]